MTLEAILQPRAKAKIPYDNVIDYLRKRFKKTHVSLRAAPPENPYLSRMTIFTQLILYVS